MSTNTTPPTVPKSQPVTPPISVYLEDGLSVDTSPCLQGTVVKPKAGSKIGGTSKIIAGATVLTTAAILFSMLGGVPTSGEPTVPNMMAGATTHNDPQPVKMGTQKHPSSVNDKKDVVIEKPIGVKNKAPKKEGSIEKNEDKSKAKDNSKTSTFNGKPAMCKVPEKLFGGKARKLPTCRMPALLTKTRNINDLARPTDAYPDVLAKHPFASDFFRPPQRDVVPPVDMGNHFVRYDEQEWDTYCNGNMSNILVPDRLVFFFIQDRGDWEREPLVDHIAPFILKARMRDYYDPLDFRTEDDYKNFLSDYHAKRNVMTIHLSFEGEVKDPQHIVKSFVETVDCTIQHMRLWYSEEQMKKLLDDARGAIMVGEFFTSPLNLHRVLELTDWYRSGFARYDSETRQVTIKDSETGDDVTSEYPPKGDKDYNWEQDFPNPPITVPEGMPFVLPEITTIYGTSDEFLANVPIATFNAQWRSLSPATRSYLRQYAPKMMRIEQDNHTLPDHIEHVMSGFRHYGKAPISAEKALSVKAMDRHYLWSFLGDLKSDRRQMNASFTNWSLTQHPGKPFHCCGGSEDVRAMYQKSTFVPIGRGHANLDCFRIYEAAGSGAIPVIVGPKQETYDSFGHFVTSKHQLPPFLFAESWESAVQEAERLMNNRYELQRKHEMCVEWFYKNFHYMQRRITALGLSHDSVQGNGYETDM